MVFSRSIRRSFLARFCAVMTAFAASCWFDLVSMCTSGWSRAIEWAVRGGGNDEKEVGFKSSRRTRIDRKTYQLRFLGDDFIHFLCCYDERWWRFLYQIQFQFQVGLSYCSNRVKSSRLDSLSSRTKSRELGGIEERTGNEKDI